MTSFLGTTSGTAGVGIPQYADDKRLMMDSYNWIETARWVPLKEAFNAGIGRGFTNGFWPGGSRLDASGDEWSQAIGLYQFPDLFAGAQSRFAFTGVTRDAYGTALGGVLVKLFKTSDGSYPGTKDILMDEVVSDVSGNFQVTTAYYPDPHYLVTYKTGSPDVQGTTVNTLIGA